MIAPTSKFKIFIISADRIAGEGMAALMAQERDLEVCGLATDALRGTEAVDAASPAVAIFNCSADRSLVVGMKDVSKSIAKVVIVREGDDEMALRVLRNGASAIVTQHDGWATMRRAIEAACNGEPFYCEQVRRFVMGNNMYQRFARRRRTWNFDPQQEVEGTADLSGREFQVFSLLAEGQRTSKIATELKLSLKTVQAYVARIKEKRGFANMHETLTAAIQWRLMSTRDVASSAAA